MQCEASYVFAVIPVSQGQPHYSDNANFMEMCCFNPFNTADFFKNKKIKIFFFPKHTQK